MFDPPFCPNPGCEAHTAAGGDGRFWRHKGYYRPNCRPQPVPRFRCRICKRGFSRQTFRMDYRDHKPWLNQQVFSRLSSGEGLRQLSRELGLAKRAGELKARKIMRHMAALHSALTGSFVDGCGFAMDELETFEVCRSTRPLTVPILIEQDSTFVVDACSAPIPPSGKMTPARIKKIAAEEEAHGKRPNLSREACARVLATAAARCRGLSRVPFRSDMKQTYPALIAEAFGADRVRHTQVHSERKRDVTNPLHRINLTLARSRDLMGRLRRRSWLVSKKGAILDLHLMAFACYRNYTQPRFLGEKKTPAERLGFIPRRMTALELLSWRQDLGGRTIHPLSPWMETADSYRRRQERVRAGDLAE